MILKNTGDYPFYNNFTRSIALKVRHHIKPIPIFFRTDIGVTIYSAKSDKLWSNYMEEHDFYLANGMPTSNERDQRENKLEGYTPYASVAVGVYYFWDFGLYLETTLIGYSYAPRTIIMTLKGADDDRDALLKNLRKDLTGSRFFGMFGKDFGMNFNIGYMF